MIVSLRARMLLAAIGAILLIPVVAIPFQDKTSLEQFHFRSLARWPSFSFLPDPARYIAEARKWIADRAYPIIQATTARNTFLFLCAAYAALSPRHFGSPRLHLS